MAQPVTQGQVIRSEWIKLRTVRSSWFVLVATVLGIAVIGLLVSYVDNAHWASMSAGDRAGRLERRSRLMALVRCRIRSSTKGTD